MKKSIQNSFFAILIIASGKLTAQCNASFNVWGNPNIPATAMVYQQNFNYTDALYIWNWGDGSANDTTYYTNWNYPSIAHTYSATGSYTVCLNYSSVSGACNISSCQGFTVSSTTLPPKSVVLNSANDSTWFNVCPQLPANVSFYMNGTVMGYTPSDSINAKVYFGDGSDTTFKVSPSYYSGGSGTISAYFNHAYTTPGLYSVQYIFLDNAGTYGDTITNYNQLDLQDTCGNLHGYMYVDINGNCQFDNSDSILSNVWINVYSSTGNYYWAWTDSLGYYSIDLPVANTYTLSVPYLNYYGYTYTCGGAGLNGVTVPSSVNIGVIFPAGFDLSGDMWGWHFTPGVGARVEAWPQNYSCLPQTGTATLTLDPNTTFVNEIYGRPVTVSGNQVIWNFSGLTSMSGWWWYYGSVDRYVGLNCSSNLQIGDSVCYTLDVAPTSGDINPANNTITRCYPVKSSWDPNFKEVYPRGVGAQGYVAQNTEFTYTIHFQNTGTAPAHNIAVLDTMDVDLDMNTFQIIAASHYVQPHVIGSNLIKFEFNNIMLPDSVTSQVASQGWVTYKIKAKANQPGGTQYTNTAYIYFDFNPTVVTNSTLNTISVGVGVNEIINAISKISVAPNPVSDFTQLTLQSTETGNVTIQIIDMLGQIVGSEEKALNKGKNIFTVDTKKLVEGIYLLNVTGANSVLGSVKIIK